MKKRFLSVVLSITVTAPFVAGCAGPPSDMADAKAENAETGDIRAGDGAGVEKKDTQAVFGEYITLTVMDGYVPKDPHDQHIYQYAEEFMKENPDIKVEIQTTVSDDICTKLAAMATSPDDLPTMLLISADQVPALYDLGLTEDLINWMDKGAIDDPADGVVNVCTIDRQMTYYPVAIQPQAVTYRVDRFGEVGLEVPATQDEFVDCAKALTRDSDGDGQVDQWESSMVGSSNSSRQSRFMSYLWSSGYELAYREDDSDEWKTDIITDPAFVDVFSKWIDMNNAKGVVPTGIIEVDYPTTANYFTMGYTNVSPAGPNALGVTYVNNPELKEKLNSFKSPGEYSGAMLGVEGYATTTKSTNVQKVAAAKYPKFLTSHDKDMEFQESSGKIPSTIEGQKVSYITEDNYAGSLKQVEDDRCPTSAFAETSGLKSALGDAYAAVFSDERTNGQAVEQLVRDFGQLPEDYN